MVPVPLRRRLFLLAAAGILPMAIMSGIGLDVLVRQQRAQVERIGLELARAVMTAVDAEIRSAINILDSLARSITVDDRDVDAFIRRAREVVATQPQWDGAALFAANGTRLADTRPGYVEREPGTEELESLERAIRTRAPAIGNLQRNHNSEFVFRIRVPVFRDGQLRYIVGAIVRPQLVQDVLARQRLDSDWLISIFDASGVRVARTRAPDENLGGRGSPSLQALMAAHGAEGTGTTNTVEGDRIYTAYSRREGLGWTAALGVPASLVDGAVRRSLAVYGGGILVSLAAAVLGAIWVARSINRPIDDLRRAATALGRREPIDPPVTDIQEIQDVGAALRSAAAERATAEREREELLRKERIARETAEAADRAKDEFLAVLSHELRTPLNAVYGWARLLQTRSLTDAAFDRAVDAIVRNSHAQAQLIDDLLDVSRIVAGKLRLDIRSVDIGAVVDEAIEPVRPIADSKRIRIDKAVDPDLESITGDPVRLKQVIWNLLVNAVKFTPADGRVQIHGRRAGAHVEISVSDTGQGIAPDLLPHVFDRFRQSDSSTTRTHGGLGIGLTLARHLVELHGGRISAESRGPGQGANFTVEIPFRTAADVPPVTRVDRRAASPDGRARASRLDGARVLAVDDDAEAIKLIEAILAGAGAEVRTAATTAAAFETLKAWRPDVLISDIEMPDEDGYSLIAKVRALATDDGGRTPAVALTAHGRMQDRVQSFAAGYNRHVPKPADPGELTAIVASLVARPQ